MNKGHPCGTHIPILLGLSRIFEIKSVIEEIKETRDILLYIANQLVNNEEDIDDEPEDD